MTYSHRSSTDPCADEPIHLVGRIQPYGLLLTAGADGLIRHISDNCYTWLEAHASAVLGTSLRAWFVSEDGAPELDSVFDATEPENSPFLLGRYTIRGNARVRVTVTVHRIGALTCFECDLSVDASGRWVGKHTAITLDKMQRAPDLSHLCNVLVEEICKLFRFSHVMVYAFDAHWDGTVLAEAKLPQVDSFLGQRFPASDIPAQARAIFLKNWFRIVEDIEAVASPIVALGGTASGPPLDLTRCFLRTSSPVHIEYLRRMGVRSTLTISLVEDGKLWGLIACHDVKPHAFDASERQAIEQMARLASSLLPQKVLYEGAAYRDRLFAICGALGDQLRCATDLTASLHAATPTFVALMGGKNTSVATFFDGVWRTQGAVPKKPALTALLAWLCGEMIAKAVYVSHQLTRDIPTLKIDEEINGLLAIRVTETKDDFLLWFRQDTVQTVRWAGKPEKKVHLCDGELFYEPRMSFAPWKEKVRGLSSPWLAVEEEVALTLRQYLVQVDLTRQIRRERQAREQVEREKLRFGLLSAVNETLGASFNTDETFARVVRILTQSFCDAAVYLRLEPAGLSHRMVASDGDAACIAALLAGMREAHDLAPATKTGSLEAFERAKSAHRVLAAPIRVRDCVQGFLYIGRREEALLFGPSDENFFAQVTLRMVSAAENALLYHDSQQATHARELILGVVSHDLRNPLTAMLLTSQVMRRRAESHFEKVSAAWLLKSLGKIEGAGARMERLIADLLSLSKIESGHFAVEAAPVDLCALITSAAELLEPLACAKSIALATALPEKSLSVVVDTARIHQVLSNLVGNALKFTPVGGSITLGAAPDAVGALLFVRDTGSGIHAQALPKIFERFWQGQPAAHHGAGLGLAITRGIVEAHGGHVWAESPPGEGATFYVQLPAGGPSHAQPASTGAH